MFGREAESPLRVNQVLKDRFQIIRVLEGKEGERRYLATDRCLMGTSWVIVDAWSDSKEIGKTIKGLKPPLLDTFSGSFEEEGRVYTLWEDVSWRKLEEILGPIGEIQAIDWLIQIAELLDALLHGGIPVVIDPISPSSILVSPEGRLALTAVQFRLLPSNRQEVLEEASLRAVEQMGRLFRSMLAAGPVSGAVQVFLARCSASFDPEFHPLERFGAQLRNLEKRLSCGVPADSRKGSTGILGRCFDLIRARKSA